MIQEIVVIPGGGFAAVTRRCDQGKVAARAGCHVFWEPETGRWKGAEIPLMDVKYAEVGALPGGQVVSMAAGRVCVWEKNLEEGWSSTELGRSIDRCAVTPDGHIVVSNLEGASIEIFKKQHQGPWFSEKIYQCSISDTPSIVVLGAGKILLVQNEFSLDNEHLSLLVEEAPGKWSHREVCGPDQKQPSDFQVLSSGLVAIRARFDNATYLWGERPDGRWGILDSQGMANVLPARVHELPCGGIVVKMMGVSLSLLRSKEDGGYQETPIWKAAQRGEWCQDLRVLPRGDMIMLLDSQFDSAYQWDGWKKPCISILRRGESDSWDMETIPLKDFSLKSRWHPDYVSGGKSMIAAFPDGKLAVRLGNHQIFIFDGDAGSEAGPL